MNVMTAGPRMNPKFIREHVILERKGPYDGGYRMSGFIVCDTCHSLVLSNADLGAAIGVGATSISRFLKREPIREDIAAKIRASVKAVV